MALCLGMGTCLTHAQNKLKVTYNEHERNYTLIDEEVEFETLDPMVLDLLAPVEHQRAVETRVNQNYHLEHTYEWVSTTYQKDYSSMPSKIVNTHNMFYIYGDNNELLDSGEQDEEAIADGNEIAAFISQEGYHPGMPNFSRPTYESLLYLYDNGFAIDSTENNVLLITDPDGRKMLFNYSENYVYEEYEDEFNEERSLNKYEFVPSIGFLLSRSIHHSIDKELDAKVTFVKDITYSDYLIHDFAGILQGTQTVQNENIRLFPVPIQENLNVELINLPNDQIQSIYIRDFQGQIVQTIVGNNMSHQVIQLQGVPQGLVTIEVVTQGGVFSRQSVRY